MISRAWVYVFFMFFLVGLISLVEYWVGMVYARYVLVYTGAVFMIGMLLGQRSERVWTLQNMEAEKDSGKSVLEMRKSVYGRN